MNTHDFVAMMTAAAREWETASETAIYDHEADSARGRAEAFAAAADWAATGRTNDLFPLGSTNPLRSG